MNKLKTLADKLIKCKLWSSDITLIQLIQSKNSSNKIIYSDGLTRQIKCVKNDTSKKISNDVFEFYTEFYISYKSLSGFDLIKNKLAIEYNEKRYIVEEIYGLGTMNNEDTLVKMVVKR